MMQIYWNKRKRLHKKRVHLPEDLFGTQTWPPFHCFGTPIWPPWRHVKTLYTKPISPSSRGREINAYSFFPSDDFVGTVVVVSSETTCYDIAASEVLQERNTKAISTILKLTEMISEACMTFLSQTLCGITDRRRTQSETTTTNEQESSFKITLMHWHVDVYLKLAMTILRLTINILVTMQKVTDGRKNRSITGHLPLP